MVSTEPYLIKLQAFEGPLDLLLYLIKKNEVNIYDIPIAEITEQYFLYLEMMRELNLEIVGDYLMLAAELGLIKSKMLLPKPEIEEEEEADPRAELVRRLLEYQRYKEAAGTLLMFDILERDVFIRTIEDDEENEASQLTRTDLWSLIDAFREIWNRKDFGSIPDIRLELELLTLEQKVEELIVRFKTYKNVLFEELFDENPTRFEIVITFLAVLELIKSGALIALQDYPYSPIKIVYIEENGISVPSR
ncbi:MAG: segregation/condensation protein A [Candidatus Dadabacteria bacterium]|nr:segregation/condensation protein A [Candidatus Dadabacteria bacterium]